MAQDRVRQADGDIQPGGTAEKRLKNCGYGLPTIPGGRGPAERGLQTLDDGRGVELPGEATGTGTMYGVREGFSNRVTGSTPPNPARCGKRGGGAEGQIGGRRLGRQDQNV